MQNRIQGVIWSRLTLSRDGGSLPLDLSEQPDAAAVGRSHSPRTLCEHVCPPSSSSSSRVRSVPCPYLKSRKQSRTNGGLHRSDCVARSPTSLVSSGILRAISIFSMTSGVGLFRNSAPKRIVLLSWPPKKLKRTDSCAICVINCPRSQEEEEDKPNFVPGNSRN